MYKDASSRTTELVEEVPWTTNFLIRPGYELYVSAQADGTVGELTCSIVADDQPIQAAIASGENALVTSTGAAP